MKTKLTAKLLVSSLCLLASATVSSGMVGAGRTGGPDSFGYTFADNAAAEGPNYDWVEISATGTQILPSSDDVVVQNIQLGFFFNFYGTDYSRVHISNNGIMFSDASSIQWGNEPVGASAIHGFIAPFWDDIVTWNGGTIYYQTLGVAPNRIFVVEWMNNQHYYSSPSGITFEAILYEGSNNILFQYKDVDFGLSYYDNGASATVGIEDPSGLVGLEYSYDEAVLNPGLAIRFKFPQTQGVNMFLSSQAPATKDHGSQMDLQMHYHNFGNGQANNVVLATTLPPGLEFVGASGGAQYNGGLRTVTWNLGNVTAGGHGVEGITVFVANDVPVGTTLVSGSSIQTSDLEVRYDDNTAQTATRVTGSSLPPNTAVEPNNGGTTPSVYWGTPVTFSYISDCATLVDILIHIDDGGPDILGSMIEDPNNYWYYTTTFYPRHGQATVTYTVHGCGTGDQTVSYDIYIDPAGYIYDQSTGDRIAGASVWLQRPDGSGGWENVPTGQSPPISQPDTNPFITGPDGQYQWDVLQGSYRVHVEAPGYYPADSIVVSIPPAVTDLHVGLVRMPVLQPVAYPLVSSRRITRTLWEYQYRFSIKNVGLGNATSVSASLQDYPSQVTIVDSTVTFPAVAAGGTPVLSSDTFTIRIERSTPVRNNQLTWQIMFTDPAGTSRTVAQLPLF